jgi:catechol 2,3-dioxygenase-like lactoylglutathione lyase family enzyme
LDALRPEGTQLPLYLVVAVTSFPANLPMISPPSSPDMSRSHLYLRVHCMTIFVRQMDRSLPFYLDQLGFRLLSDTQESIGRWVAVAPPDGTAILVLVQPKPESDEYRLIGHSRYVIFVTEDVPAKFVEWSQRGVRFRDPPKAEAWGGVVTGFEDMDGNSFVLVGYDAASREIRSATALSTGNGDRETSASEDVSSNTTFS